MIVVVHSKAKVPQLHIVVLVEEDVKRLQVSVDEAALVVQVVECFHYLVEYSPLQIHIRFPWIGSDEVLQCLSLTELHLDVQDAGIVGSLG
jgi:hypothetical protein